MCSSPAAFWRLATDWEEYALVMREVLEAHPDFENVNPGAGATEEDPLGGWAPRWEGRTLTSLSVRLRRRAPRARSDLPPQVSGAALARVTAM